MSTLKVIYILPNETAKTYPSEFTHLTFEEFAKRNHRRAVSSGNRFAKSLIRWVEPAGSQRP